MRSIIITIASCVFLLLACSNNADNNENPPVLPEIEGKIIVAYVTSWGTSMPDVSKLTHINYAFGHINETFDGIRIDEEERFKAIAGLKQNNLSLKVLLSVGGFGSGGFSEMAADDAKRMLFANDCKRVIDEYGLDGVDIDWEYPTFGIGGISSLPDDSNNFSKLMKDIRSAIGNEKLLTIATDASAKFIPFKDIVPYISYINIMGYEYAYPPYHHSALYSSERTKYITSDDAVKKHMSKGVPKNKLVLGVPFYGVGDTEKGLPGTITYKAIGSRFDSFEKKWDDMAKVPYYADADGLLVFSYDDAESLKHKCQYVVDNDLLGIMYWQYDGDDEQGTLRTTVNNALAPYIR